MVVRNTYKGLYHTKAILHRGRTQRVSLAPQRTSLPVLPPFIETEKESERENMRSLDPTLPSVTFVLSQPALTTRGSTRRRGKFSIRRSKSSPSFGARDGPHPPRYPPQLNSDFLEVRESLSNTVSFFPR